MLLRLIDRCEVVVSAFGPSGSDSIPEVHILQRLINVHLFYERNSLLQIVTFLAGHPKLASLDRNLDFDLGAFDRFGDFASQVGVNPLPNGYGTPDGFTGCILCRLEFECSLVYLSTCKIPRNKSSTWVNFIVSSAIIVRVFSMRSILHFVPARS